MIEKEIRSFFVLLSAYFLVCILLSGKFFKIVLLLCDPSGGCHVCTIYAQDTINVIDDYSRYA